MSRKEKAVIGVLFAVLLIGGWAGINSLSEQTYLLGCLARNDALRSSDYQARLKCIKFANAYTWGRKADIAWGDEYWIWDRDLKTYLPLGGEPDKSKFYQ